MIVLLIRIHTNTHLYELITYEPGDLTDPFQTKIRAFRERRILTQEKWRKFFK